jgi:hypothetical protein
MAVRVWWFLVGTMVGVCGTLRVLQHVERAKAALTPANLARNGALTFADMLDAGAARLAQGRH